MQQTRFARIGKRIAASCAAVITLLGLGMTASATDTITVTSKSYTISYNTGSSKWDGFGVSAGTMAICTQLDKNPPGEGGASYKVAKNLGSSYTDDTIKIDTKFAIRCMYYAAKNWQSNADLKGLSKMGLSLATNATVRGYFSSSSVTGSTDYSKQIIKAVKTIRTLANADADKINSKITISGGVATFPNGSYTARAAFFTSSGLQRVLIYEAQWQKNSTPDVPVDEKGAIEVYKKDGNGNALAGARFEATNTVTKEVYDIGPTNASGYAISKGGASNPSIPIGTYTVKETVFPTNYTHNGTTSWTVTVTANATAKIGGNTGVINIRKKGAIGVHKVGVKDGVQTPLDGVTFGVYSDAACTKKVGEMVTGANGNPTGDATLGNLDVGAQYWVKELANKDGDYELNTKPYYEFIKENTTAFVNSNKPFPNYLKKGAVGVQKVNENGDPLEGVVFGVYSDAACATKVTEITTDADGKAYYGVDESGNYTLECKHDYWVKELKTGDEYELDETAYKVSVEAEKITYANGRRVINFYKKGALWVRKTDVDGNYLSGVTFGVYADAACTKRLGITNTGALGIADFGVDKNGKYTLDPFVTLFVKELQAKSDIYELDETVYPVTIQPGKIVIANDGAAIVNRYKKGALAAIKVDKYGNRLSGVTFGVYSDEACTQLVTSIVTNANGVAEYGVDKSGQYTLDPFVTLFVRDLQAKNKYYVLNTTVYPVTIQPDEQITANDGQGIVNQPRYGSISVIKTQNGNRLANVSFLLEISRDGGKTWTPVTVNECPQSGLKDGILTANASGFVRFYGLESSDTTRYRLTEIKTVNGNSLLSEPIYEGTIPANIDGTERWQPTFTVNNNAIMALPAAGGHGLWVVTLGVAALTLLVVLGCTMKSNKGKEEKVQ